VFGLFKKGSIQILGSMVRKPSGPQATLPAHVCGLKAFSSAARFYRLFDEIRTFLRPQSWHNQLLSHTQRRDMHRQRFVQLIGMIAAV
jgi:hypothetical protein